MSNYLGVLGGIDIVESFYMVEEISFHTRPYPNRKKKNIRWRKKWKNRYTDIRTEPSKKVLLFDVPGGGKRAIMHPSMAVELRKHVPEYHGPKMFGLPILVGGNLISTCMS